MNETRPRRVTKLALARRVRPAPGPVARGLGHPLRLSRALGRQRCGARSRARPLKIDLFLTAPRGGVRGAVRRGSACMARSLVLPA